MKNTPANKVRFFALYWGQKVMKSNEWMAFEGGPILVNPTLSPAWGIWYLELKPLSQITDEDFLELAKDYLRWSEPEDFKEFFFKINEGRPAGPIQTDFFRSKGYALPWMGISVEEQIQFGWVKLKEDKL